MKHEGRLSTESVIYREMQELFADYLTPTAYVCRKSQRGRLAISIHWKGAGGKLCQREDR